jgi:hypothetical protein
MRSQAKAKTQLLRRQGWRPVNKWKVPLEPPWKRKFGQKWWVKSGFLGAWRWWADWDAGGGGRVRNGEPGWGQLSAGKEPRVRTLRARQLLLELVQPSIVSPCGAVRWGHPIPDIVCRQRPFLPGLDTLCVHSSQDGPASSTMPITVQSQCAVCHHPGSFPQGLGLRRSSPAYKLCNWFFSFQSTYTSTKY